jgi:hypothetical protein
MVPWLNLKSKNNQEFVALECAKQSKDLFLKKICDLFVLMFHLYLDIQFQVFQILIHNGLGKDSFQYD